MTKPVKRRKKANIGPKNRGTNRVKKHRQQQFMDESQRSEETNIEIEVAGKCTFFSL